jgi:hypothetical protein
MSAETPTLEATPAEVKTEDSTAPETTATLPEQTASTPAPPAATGLNKQELDVLDGIVRRLSEVKDPEE